MQKEPSSATRRKKKRIIVASAILVPVAVYTLFGFFVLPQLIKSMVPGKLSDAINREVQIDRVAVNPFALTLSLEGCRVKDQDGKIFTAFEQLFINLQVSSLFKRAMIVNDIQLIKPYARIIRQTGKTFNFSDLLSAKTPDTPSTDSPTTSPEFYIRNLVIAEGRFAFSDNSLSTRFETALASLNITVHDLSNQAGNRATFKISGQTPENESISGEGTFSLFPFHTEGTVELQKFIVKKYAPFYRDVTRLDVADGTASVSTRFRLHENFAAGEAALFLTTASLDSLQLVDRKSGKNILTIPKLSLQDSEIDLVRRSANIGVFSSQNGFLLCQRFADGTLNLNRFVGPALVADNLEPREPPAATEKPWQAGVKSVLIKNYALQFEDLTPADPVNILLDQMQIEMKDLTTGPNGTGWVSVALRVNNNGKVSVQGPVTVKPPSADLDVNLSGIEIRSLQPYFSEKVKLTVANGKVNAAGRINFSYATDAGPTFGYLGEASITGFKSMDKAKAQDFLAFKSLHLSNINAGYKPVKISIEKVALNDFFSRLIINPDGTVNFRTIFSHEDETKEKAPDAAAEKKPEKAKPAEPDAKAVADTDKKFSPEIEIGAVVFQGGTVSFFDRLSKPFFKAEIRELGGNIAGLSSKEQSRADVFLKGRHGNAAPLEVKGTINPLIANRYADVKITFSDIEMSPFSPYSGKYLGYLIQKGQLNLELEYTLEANKIKGKNRIFLDQFTLGDKVDSPEATSLPVKLGIALLKDRNGEIELDFPVVGDIDDPQFNIGKIVIRVLVNLFEKIISAPFSALVSMVSGGAELSYIDFEYGGSHISASMQARLDKLIAALYDRPALELEIQGAADPRNDREALRQLRFSNLLKTQKRKEMIRRGIDPMPLIEMEIEPENFETYLEMAYRASDIPKPRDETGKIKALPAEEMQKLLVTSIQIRDEDLRLLAHARAAAVEKYMVKSQKIAPRRIFILEPVRPASKEKKDAHKSRVNFSLK